MFFRIAGKPSEGAQPIKVQLASLGVQLKLTMPQKFTKAGIFVKLWVRKVGDLIQVFLTCLNCRDSNMPDIEKKEVQTIQVFGKQNSQTQNSNSVF